MPIARRCRESVAPVLIVGTTGAPGHIFDATLRIAAGTNPSTGEYGPKPKSPVGAISTAGSATTRRSVSSVCSAVSSGRIRQLTVASADVGNTLSCGDPASWVVTQVV